MPSLLPLAISLVVWSSTLAAQRRRSLLGKLVNCPVQGTLDGRAVGGQQFHLEFVTLSGRERRNVEGHHAAAVTETRGLDVERVLIVVFGSVIRAAPERPGFERERV